MVAPAPYAVVVESVLQVEVVLRCLTITPRPGSPCSHFGVCSQRMNHRLSRDRASQEYVPRAVNTISCLVPWNISQNQQGEVMFFICQKKNNAKSLYTCSCPCIINEHFLRGLAIGSQFWLVLCLIFPLAVLNA